MTIEPEDEPDMLEYDIGYGKPPKSGQFKRGESGNPKGRKRKPKSVQSHIRTILTKRISINEGRKTRCVALSKVMLRSIAVSYAQGLASKLHNDYRAILSALWYRDLFPATRTDPKEESEQEVRLTQRGVRLATSVGGVLTGRAADIIIIDDPLKADDAYSEAQRNKVNDWYGSALVSRLNQKTDGAIVIVTQRLHVDDLVGHVTEHNDEWTVLNLPAIAPEDQNIKIGTDRTHYRAKGTLLHPARETQAVLDELKQSIGAEAFEAQYQQCPVPPGGHMFKRDWLNYFPMLPEITDKDTVFQS